jgi:opacity protein-like surface antigen
MAALRRRPRDSGCLGLICCWCWLGWADAARADVLDRWYVGLGVGWSYAETLELDANDATMELDQGTNQLNGVLGRRLGDDWRVELDYTEFENDPELLYSSSAAIEIDTDERDSVGTSSLMLNLVRDLHVGRAWRPYLGVGAGIGRVDVHFSELEINGPFFQRPRRDIIDDDDTGLALQLMAGLTVPLTRRLELAADFRYWHMPGVDLEEVSGADVDTDHSVRSAWLHLRYHGAIAAAYGAPRPRQPLERGWYVTGNLGGGFAQDEDIEDQLLVIDAFDLGTTVTVGAGYHLRPRWRVELEASYWENALEVMEFSPDIGEDRASGSVESYSLMLNVIHQFAPGSTIRPFVGIGGGWIRSSYDITTSGFCRNFVCDPVEQRDLLIDDTGTAAAAQAMVGVDVAISGRLRFSAAHRQLITGTTDMNRPDGTPFNTERRHITSITAGLRYSLGR